MLRDKTAQSRVEVEAGKWKRGLKETEICSFYPHSRNGCFTGHRIKYQP